MRFVTVRVKISVLMIILFYLSTEFAFSDEKIRVGVIAPLSGAAAELGTQIKNGILLAKDNLETDIAFVFEDGACDPKTARSAAQKLVSLGKVPVVIGPLCSPPFLASAPLLNAAKITFIHTSSGTPNTSAGKGVFGIEGTATVMEEHSYLAKHVRDKGISKVAIIHFEQEWATGHADAFQDSFEKLGGTIVIKEAFTNVNETDYRPYLMRMQLKKPEAIFIGAFNGHTGTILKQMRKMGIKTQVFAQYDIEDPLFIDVAGESANGVQYTYPFDNENLSPAAEKFHNEYLKRFGKTPSFYPYNGYDIALIVDKALKKCSSDSACVKREILAIKNFKGLTGKLSFTEDGTISRTFIMKEVQDLKFKKLG